ncbi:MAG: glycerate kinase [Eubacteriaceae bacterium]|jgi:glycerate kinase
MKVVIAIDSLKGSLSSLEAGKAISEGIGRVNQEAQISVRPLADGGEGTVEALTSGMNGKLETVQVTGSTGEKVEAAYGILEESDTLEKKTAIVEMSAGAGITLVTEENRNPLKTTTYGVGEIIKDAIQKGCRHFIVGIGGSATNDGGIGMLQALGYGILDQDGKQVSAGAQGLSEIDNITDESVIPELKECTFRIACDVTNPLCGEQGCSAIYGPQKGATPSMIVQMDQWLSDYAAKSKEKYPHADMNQAGSGAAGGLGFAFLTYTNAVLESGIKIVLEETRLEDFIKDADFVVTGEGRLDGQTAMGKAPIGVAEIAKKYGKKVIAFSGCVTEDAVVCNEHGIDAFFPILRSVGTLSDAMDAEKARMNMTAAVEQVFRLIECCA